MIYPHILKTRIKENHLFRKIIKKPTKNQQKSDFSSIELRFFYFTQIRGEEAALRTLGHHCIKKCCDYSSVHKPRYNSIGH